MGKLQRIWEILTQEEKAPYEDQSEEEDNKVTVKDLLRFMEKTQEQNTRLIESVLASSNSQSRTLETYIDLFKPKEVKSTSLEDRENNKNNKVKVRASEWEGIESVQDFHMYTAGPGVGIPPEPPGDFIAD